MQQQQQQQPTAPLIKKKRPRGGAHQRLTRATDFKIQTDERDAKELNDDEEDDEQIAADLASYKRARITAKQMSGGVTLASTKRINGGTESTKESGVRLGDGYAASRELRASDDDQGATAVNRLEVERQAEMKQMKKTSVLLAGPVKGSVNVRVSGRFDFQPDICKDYYETGFCGYGWNCKFAHIREEHKTGYEVEREWEEEQRRKKLGLDKLEAEGEESKQRQIGEGSLAIDVDTEGIPFACYLCRKPFTDPVVTQCKHYFCERCILTNYRSGSKPTCPICHEQTHGIFNTPSRDIMRKLMRKSSAVSGSKKQTGANRPNSEEDEEEDEDQERQRINQDMRKALAVDRSTTVKDPIL